MTGVNTDQQMGLADEPVDESVGVLMREWWEAQQPTAGARATLKFAADAKDKVREALPDVAGEHRYTYIDETLDPPVQYVVNTTPPTEPKDIAFRREPRPRMQIDQREPRVRR